MIELKKDELEQIVGGINITAALFTALSKAAKTVYEIGQAVGSAVRRLYSKDLCKC